MNISLDETKINEVKTKLSLLANTLLDALENNDRAQAFIAQQALTGAVNILWNEAEVIDIDPKVKAISRLVAGWAKTELPNQIKDPANNATIKRELKLFQRSLMMFS